MRDIGASAGGVLSYFTRHRTVANLLLVLMVVAGLYAFPKMRAQFFPDVVFNSVQVSVAWSGAGAEDVDTAIVQVMEPALLAIDGVDTSSAQASEGRAAISLEFKPGWDMAQAVADVQAAVDLITDLPSDAEDVIVRRAYWSDLVTDVVVSGPIGVAQLGLLTDELVLRLFDEGVTNTSVTGLVAPETVIEVPTLSLMAHDLSISEIAATIGTEVTGAPAGDITGANMRVRTGREKRSVEDISGIILRSFPDGSSLTVGDVARVRMEGVTRARSYFVDGVPAMMITVNRDAKGDSIGIQATVQDSVDDMAGTLPEGVEMRLVRTRAEAISSRLNLLMNNGSVGLLLVVAVLFLFLNARTAFWVAAGIPVAMFAAVALMYVAGLTINMISLFALIITLGIVVDDAIVVGEHADARHRHMGESPVQAAENAARRMAMPVFSATLTTVIAFSTMAMIGGRFGDMIFDIPFTVVVVLIASLLECFLVLPNHMAHALAGGDGRTRWYDVPSQKVNAAFLFVRTRYFTPLMQRVVLGRYLVLSLVILALASQLSLVIGGQVGWRFFTGPERGVITGNFSMVAGASRQDSIDMMRELERATNAVAARYEAEHGANPLAFVMTQVGGNSGRGLAGARNKDGDQLGSIDIELIDGDLRSYSAFAVVNDLKEEMRPHPLMEQLSFRSGRMGPGGESLDIRFYGADSATLKSASLAVQEALARYPEVSGVEDNLVRDKEELILDLTPKGQSLGFTAETLARVMRARLNGVEAATYPVGPRSAAIRVEVPANELTADFLEATQIRSPKGTYAALGDVVQVTSRDGFSTITRENGLRLIAVTGELSEDNPERAQDILLALRQEILPAIASANQVDWEIAGLSEQENEFLRDAQIGFMLCLLGIYLVLSWVFNSWTRPLVVMAIIPFGLVGAVLGHYVHGVTLSMFSIIGLLGMTGIIINDSIVLITTIDEHAARRPLKEAIVSGTVDRLRPVLLTTLTTVLGLFPILFEKSVQAQFLIPTVITLVYGLGVGFFLVLLVVPALLAIQGDVGRSLRIALGARHRQNALAQLLKRAALGVGVWGICAMILGAFMGAKAAFALFVIGVAGLMIGVYVMVGRSRGIAG